MDLYSKVSQIVSSLYQTYRTENVMKLCKCMGVEILPVDIHQILGIGLILLDHKKIIINEHLPNSLQLRIIAHKLGHLIMHSGDLFIMRDYQDVSLTRDIEAEIFTNILLKK